MAELYNRFVEGRRGARALGAVLLGVGVFLFISLATYSPGDYPNGSRPPDEATNWGGRIGAQIAYVVFIGLGYAAYVIPVLCILWGVGRMRGSAIAKTAYRSTGVLSIALLLCVASGLPQYSAQTAFKLGGWLGTQICDIVLIPYIGRIGATVLLGALLVAALILTTDIRLAPLARAALGLARLILRLARRVLGLPGAWIGRLARFAARYRAGRAARRDRAGRRSAQVGEDREEERDEPEEEGPEAAAGLPAETRAEIRGPLSGTEVAAHSPADGNSDTAEGRSGCGDAEIAPVASVDTGADGPRTTDAATATLPRRHGRGARDKMAPPASSTEGYRAPEIDLLDDLPSSQGRIDEDVLLSNARLLEQALSNFDVGGRVVEVSPGPVVTRYEVEPAAGVKVSRILTLSDDLARVMSANGIRIQAPVPGKSVVGVEIANQHRETVYLREILESKAFRQAESRLTMALGKNISGQPFVADLSRMPHLLVAGATGAGKSVCINCLICSMLFKSSPDEVRFLMVDPKVVELTMYDGIPHLLVPVVTEPKKAAEALKWAVAEMEVRYQKLAKMGVRNLADYNRKVAKRGTEPDEDGVIPPRPLPYIVIVIDEFADLMLTASADVETSLMALAQKSRAVGIHIILATQRPSVNVITGVIKANFPSRIAFQVATKTDSRTILDMNGAERLLGRGDMLFLPGGQGEPLRVHGAYVSSEETEALVEALKATDYQVEEVTVFGGHVDISAARNDQDELFDEAVRIVVEYQQASTSFLQRRMKVGYSRAARLMDELEKAGVVGPPEGARPRQILVDEGSMDPGGA